MEHILVEIVDQDGNAVKDGTTGDVLVTQLENYAMPVIRYQIGDLSSLITDPCECGRNLQRLGPITGRTTDLVRLPDGSFLTGLAFPHIFKDFSIDFYQVHQRSDRSVDVQLVLSKSLDPAGREDLLGRLELALQRKLVGVELRIHPVERIAKTSSGKLRTVISDLD
jgi:phenylacetate-CoA ligase